MGISVVLLGNQLPVPSQQGLRRDHAGELGKSLSSQRSGLYGQPLAAIVIEAHSLATELFRKHPVLLAKIFNGLLLAVVHPPGDGDQHKSEWVEHSLLVPALYRERRAWVANDRMFIQIQFSDIRHQGSANRSCGWQFVVRRPPYHARVRVPSSESRQL